MGLKRTRAWLGLFVLLSLVAAACGDRAGESSGGGQAGGSTDSGSTIKVGILHSLSGTMAISEVSVRDPELLAVEEINAKGGVLGKEARGQGRGRGVGLAHVRGEGPKLISVDKVATTFGGWTSASRKAMPPCSSGTKALLWYPVQYEGLETSPYIFYTGATTNQQIIRAWTT